MPNFNDDGHPSPTTFSWNPHLLMTPSHEDQDHLIDHHDHPHPLLIPANPPSLKSYPPSFPRSSPSQPFTSRLLSNLSGLLDRFLTPDSLRKSSFLPTTTHPRTPAQLRSNRPLARLLSNQNLVTLLLSLSFLFTLYLLLVPLLDQPNSLDLDPTIDPITFQLRPTGDPLNQTHPLPPSPQSVALSHLILQRETGFYLRMQHAIQRNITSNFNSSIIPQAIRFAQQHLINSEKQDLSYRWYNPDPALIHHTPPSHFPCHSQSPTLIFLGIFTHPAAFEKRNLIRTLFKPDLPPNGLIESKFILGEPENANWYELIKAEQAIHQDIVILKGVRDNIDEGKTYEYFRWIVERETRRKDPEKASRDSSSLSEDLIRDQLGLNGWIENYPGSSLDDRDPRKPVYQKPRFVIKSDDDTFLVIPNLIKSFKDLDCRKNIYWGTSQGSSKLFGPYFRGLGYGLSWPLVEWIGSSSMSLESRVGIEDARVGAWLTDLNPTRDPLVRIEEGWKMADWNQVEIDEDTIALHWLKATEWYPMIRLKVLQVWKSAKRSYKWDYFL